ncbi:MAG: Tex-like N-terminal domain-containing protein, partial [Rothia dentocariosa]
MSEKHERAEATNTRILTMLAKELDLKPTRVRAAVKLLDSGASVPFIARYRKEATGALTDTHLRAISTRLDALRALETRRENILSSLAQRREDGLIDPLTYEQLITGVGAASSKQDLEALYAPYRSERITKAERARAAGLEALVEDLLEVPLAEVYDIAAAYVDEPNETDDKQAVDAGKSEGTGITTVEEALDGARAILIDRALTDPTLAERLHE